MIDAIWIFLIVVVGFGFYRVGLFDGIRRMKRPRYIHNITYERRAPDVVDIRMKRDVSMAAMMASRDAATKQLSLAYNECIESVLRKAVDFIELEKGKDDYGYTVRVGARLRVVGNTIIAEAVRDHFKDDEGWLSRLDYFISGVASQNPALADVFQRARERAIHSRHGGEQP